MSDELITKIELVDYINSCMATSVKDLGTNRQDVILWGVFVGWDDNSYEDFENKGLLSPDGSDRDGIIGLRVSLIRSLGGVCFKDECNHTRDKQRIIRNFTDYRDKHACKLYCQDCLMVYNSGLDNLYRFSEE